MQLQEDPAYLSTKCTYLGACIGQEGHTVENKVAVVKYEQRGSMHVNVVQFLSYSLPKS